MEEKRPTAAIYCRISADREGRRLGVERQEEDARVVADEKGYEVSQVYVENDTSASTKSKKPRPLFEAMMRRAESGDFDAIISYSSSRLTRRPMEYERLIALAQDRGVLIHYANTDDNDLTTARGRRRARDDAARDAEEAEETGEKVALAVRQRAKRGEWHGGHVPHGYRTEDDMVPVLNRAGEPTGRLRVAQRLVVDPATAPLMKEAARRLLSGESLYAIAADFNARGLLTSKGSHWRSQTIRKAMLSPSIVGKREVKEYVRKSGKKVLVSSTLYDGQWEPLIAEKAWTQLRELLTDTSRKFGPMDGNYSGKRPLGGGLTVCADCGKPLVSARYGDAIRLVCHKQATGGCGGVTITYEPFEDWLVELVMGRIDSPRWRAESARTAAKVDTRADRLRGERRMLQEERGRVVRSFDLGVRSEEETVKRVREIDAQVAGIDGRLSDLAADTVLDPVTNVEDARRLWREADTTKRRRFLASMIETVHVHKWPEGMPTKLTRRTSERMAARHGWVVETEEEFAKRQDEHRREALRQRVCIKWRR